MRKANGLAVYRDASGHSKNAKRNLPKGQNSTRVTGEIRAELSHPFESSVLIFFIILLGLSTTDRPTHILSES
jgi:hypothetical protein